MIFSHVLYQLSYLAGPECSASSHIARHCCAAWKFQELLYQ